MDEGRQTQRDLPPAQRHIIPRPRLTKLLDEAEARIILLVAPAGYGKTTLAREWLAKRGRQALLFRVRDTIDPTAVAEGLASAIEPVAPDARRALKGLLSASTNPDQDPELLSELVAQETGTWHENAWLFIDDYQAIIGVEACERVVAHFVDRVRPHVLITSRDRPSWITPRSLLYGEAFEFNQDALAMTQSEGEQVLAAGDPKQRQSLLAVAKGWPAVIGLAALVPEGLTLDKGVPSALYDYLASELYDGLTAEAKSALAVLALPSFLDRAIVAAAVGASAGDVIRDAHRAGFLAVRENNEFEIHPLARAFLRGKLSEITVGHETLVKLLSNVSARGDWDDAFTLVSEFALIDELPRLLQLGVPSLLSRGRLATVDRWVKWGQSRGVEGPEISLARAELHYRRGDWQLAESLAASAARGAPTPEFAARCYICAGQSAHLLDEHGRAADHLSDALAADDSSETNRRALWGRFLASFLEDPQSSHAPYRAMVEANDSTPAHLVRLSQARLLMSSRHGDIASAINDTRWVEPMVELVDDPVIRTGFLNSLADLHVIAGLYDDAERLVDRELSEAKRFRLEFVMPNALFNLAGAKLGQGQYTSAWTLVDRAGAEKQTDAFLRANAHGIRIRIALSRQDSSAVRRLLFDFTETGLRADIIGEVFACIGLAEAIFGSTPRACNLVARAKERSTLVTTRVLTAAVESILALDANSDHCSKLLHDLASVATQTGAIDSVVVALRASPRLLDASSRHERLRPVARLAARRSQDPTLAAATGIALDRKPVPSELSPRELEVLGLVAEGFRNDEVAQRLFISPKTVKAHLQHIYEKLEVRSRTEAVTRAREARLLS